MKKIVGLMILGFTVFLYGCSNTTNDVEVTEIEKIAQCLGEKGVIMYGTNTCPFCLQQKEAFGDNFGYINYVDCSVNPNACSKLEGVPTREFPNGELLAGLQRLSFLAEKAGCNL